MIDDYGDSEFNCDNASTELFDQSLSRVINSDHDESVTLRVMMMTTTMMLTTTTMMLTTTRAIAMTFLMERASGSAHRCTSPLCCLA